MTPPTPSLRPPQAPSWVAAVVALTASIGSLVSAWQTAQSSESTQRATYEALRLASAEHTAQLAELAQSQRELRAWVEELSGRLSERATVTEKALRKVVKPKSPLPAPTPPPPAPPPVAEVRPSAPLPSFEELAR